MLADAAHGLLAHEAAAADHREEVVGREGAAVVACERVHRLRERATPIVGDHEVPGARPGEPPSRVHPVERVGVTAVGRVWR